MNFKEASESEELIAAKKKFDTWRSKRQGKERIPDELWQLAIKLS